MNKYEADEILNIAIMSKTPCIIVEGADDIRIYEEISESANVECDVYAVEMLEGLVGGNDGVIAAVEIIESLPMPSGKTVNQYVTGVIDCDARYYRNEVPNFVSLFSLRAYSIESHFVSKFAIRPAISRITRISSQDEVDVESIYLRIEQNMSSLYYFSLDALKNAVDPSYVSIVGFSTKPGRRRDVNTLKGLDARVASLDEFAENFHLDRSIDSLKKFVKGKWLITAFSEELFSEITQLVTKCKSLSIRQCRMCERDHLGPCLFQIRGGFNKNLLNSVLVDFVDAPDFDYIRDKFRSLAKTATQT